MIRLRDLRSPSATTWRAAEQLDLPVVTGVDRYNIATDCLSHPADHPAVIEAGGDAAGSVLTFGDLRRRSAALAGALVAGRLLPGDRVAIKLSQSIDMAVAVFAALRAGGIVVPISNVLAESGLQHRLGDARPAVVIAADGDPIGALIDPTTTRLLGIGELRRLCDAASTSTSNDDELPDTSASTPALLLYTSGTTGKPKGVLQAQRFLLGHHAIDLAFDHVDPTDVAFSPVDWTWAGGLMLGLLVPLAHGVTVIAHRDRHFDPEAALHLMRGRGVSIGLFPPTVLRMIRAAGVFTTESVASTRLRCFITGAEAVEPDLIEWGRALGISINNAYGQTEANALIGHAATLEPLPQSSMGRPYPGRRIGILDEQLASVDDGVAGQLAVDASDLVCMLEYWNNPEATAAKIRAGWLLTGDTVHRNPDGTLQFHGRNDDIIKSGAYRLGPAEIEGAMLRHPDVAECAAIGLPDEIRGQIVAAVVRVRPAAHAGDDLVQQLQALVRSTVGAHAYPRVVRFVDQLPKTTTNKIDRATLRSSMIEGRS